MTSLRKVIFITSVAVITSSVWLGAVSPEKKIYHVPNAMVTYMVTGGGALSADVNLTIEGNGTLRFREWGAVELFETHIIEKTEGAVYYRNEVDKCEKRQEKQILDVDYKNQKILERPLPHGKKYSSITEGMENTGQQQMVGNVICNMWKRGEISRCVYKGIPLLTEYRALGFFYREEATDVQFDMNETVHEKCTIPDFPVQKFALVNGSFKTVNNKSPQIFSERIKKVIHILEKKKRKGYTPSQKVQKQLMDMMGEPVFETLKKHLPQLLKTMKKTRACLVQTPDTKRANQCLEEMLKVKSLFTQDMNNDIQSWEKESKKTLDLFDTHIALLQSKMKCIRASKNFSDLSMCMKP